LKISIACGGRFYIHDLARQMVRLGHLNRLFTGYPKWRVEGIPPEKLRVLWWLVGGNLALNRINIFNRPDLVNLHMTRIFDRWVASRVEECDVFHALSNWAVSAHPIYKKRYGALTVCDRGSSHILFQDEILREEHERWGIPYRPINRGFIERELEDYEQCDLITVPSTFAYRSFLEKGVPENKLAKLSFGVDLRIFRQVQKEDDVFRVIYVGGMILRKGVPYLLEALAPLKLPKFEVLLIGGMSQEVKPFFSKYDGKFRYLGALPQKELYRFYSQSSVFVMATIEDGFGLVQAQAMACGLPVIATSNSGAEDLFEDGVEGFVVPIRDPEAIREKVLFLYKNRDVLKEMGEASLRKAQGLGGWDAYGERAVEIYKDGLDRLR